MNQNSQRAGNLIVITGPSGVGKGTAVGRLLVEVPNILRSISVTTRFKRPNEEEGKDYFFATRDEFLEMIEQHRFLEWAEYADSLYGTPAAWVKKELEEGVDVILEIEVQGAKQVMMRHPEAVLVFLAPPSFSVLEDRLRGRQTEAEDKILTRLEKARQELSQKHLFQYEVINDNLDEAVENLKHIVYAERCRIVNSEAESPLNEHDENS